MFDVAKKKSLILAACESSHIAKKIYFAGAILDK